MKQVRKVKNEAMKTPFKLFLSLTLNFLILSCDPPQDPMSPAPDVPQGSVTGAVTPAGAVEGAAVSKKIGPGGGTVQSEDNRIRIAIPPGALASEQTISVQPIHNNCPSGSGQAFRLAPHGAVFAKPVTITFNYGDEDINGSSPELLKIAYQTEQGIWQSPATKHLDTAAHVLSVETMHFSDWGVFQKMYIDPIISFMNPGANASLNVYEVPDFKSPGSEDEELIVAIPKYVPAANIEKWILKGEGILKPSGNKADYFAPSTIPAINPAVVTVFLNKSVIIDGKEFKDLRLVSSIYVAPEGLSVQIDGGGWRTYAGGANINGSHNVISGRDGAETVSIAWKGAQSGTFHWTKSADVSFNINKGRLVYQHLYGKGPFVSGGSLMVDNSDPLWVLGTFTVQPAGWLDTSQQIPRMGTAGVRGVFRMKRVN